MPGIKSIKITRNIDSHNQSDTPLQGSSGPTATVLIRRPYIPGTFDRVLRSYWTIRLSLVTCCTGTLYMCISWAQQCINRAVRTERVLDVLIKKDGWGNTPFVLKCAFWLICITCQKSHVQRTSDL
jgi:hypothetical protein